MVPKATGVGCCTARDRLSLNQPKDEMKTRLSYNDRKLHHALCCAARSRIKLERELNTEAVKGRCK